MKFRYRHFQEEIAARFGERIFRITVNTGLSCPNVDGTKAKGGCTFCNELSYTGFTSKEEGDIRSQIENGMRYVSTRHKTDRFFVYYQNGTNTYAPVEKLRTFFEPALLYKEVVGVMITTRPDSLPPEVVDYLSELNEKTYLWVELGLQSHRNDVLRKINRAHTAEDFLTAAETLHKRGIRVGTHVILGLPGETKGDARDKALFLNQSPVGALKVHNLVVFKDTTLAKSYEAGHFAPQSMEEYMEDCIDFLEHLRPDIFIQRFNAHGPEQETVAPAWSINKWNVINLIHQEMEKRDTWQGRKFSVPK